MKPDDGLTVRILALNTDDILQVYSGVNGRCCCGCSGKHTYNPDFRAIGSENRGYEVDEEDCNMKTVKAILNKIKRNVSDPTCDWQDDFVSVVLGTDKPVSRRELGTRRPGRLYVAYFKPTEKELQERREWKAQRKAEAAAKEASALQGAGI